MPRTKPDSRHHHGQLREALILAGLELMQSGGPDALTLRKCAALAGVSHAAPAHHFHGLISLKAAIVARGYRIFTQTMRDARDKAADEPRARLDAVCAGYIAFSRAHPALFKFMFRRHEYAPGDIDAVTMAELDRESTAAYLVLRAACAPFAHPDGDNVNTETLVWSLVHGYAMLFGDAQNRTSPAGYTPEFSRILAGLHLALKPDSDRQTSKG